MTPQTPTRWKLVLEYDGGGFVGWQRQDSGRGVQQAVEEAVRALSGEDTQVQAAGRTDSGVHALAQVAHVDLLKPLDGDTLRDALNHFLRTESVVVLSAEAAAEGFHARFSASERAYLYRILNRRPPPTLEAGRVWWVPTPLDAAAMHAGAQRLVGHHDFTSFRASECQAASPVKTLDALDVIRDGTEIRITARARSFLHHQMRNIAGTLRLVGEGKWTPDDVTRALDARCRSAAGPTAPPEGLYLTHVRYDDA
ncbi:tRNA pseudouridine(38-40) synthase TruA [Rhodovibrio salinarum]|uniref:tRNA pseudouridine synthase A n=1 Tax=Rhodovibrio salinarum TaxID=1087 RepID=A0A934QH88_9PROT|nr:tRNA pseudouridine(38-40) synthase TruA [Rhodovibrio salinarum]MBK1696829.1 tRNA pseudouridine(38-40) synthase TruA [Rhodovibrio salinarum]